MSQLESSAASREGAGGSSNLRRLAFRVTIEDVFDTRIICVYSYIKLRDDKGHDARKISDNLVYQSRDVKWLTARIFRKEPSIKAINKQNHDVRNPDSGRNAEQIHESKSKTRLLHKDMEIKSTAEERAEDSSIFDSEAISPENEDKLDIRTTGDSQGAISVSGSLLWSGRRVDPRRQDKRSRSP